MINHHQATSRTHPSPALAACALALVGASAVHAVPITLDSVKESYVRESDDTNQGQTRLIFGAQGSDTSEFHTMMQFSLADLVTATGGQAITVSSVSLDSGAAFVWNSNGTNLGINGTSDFGLYQWAVSDFNVADNKWSDPQGGAGADATGGGTLGTLLSTETFGPLTTEGNLTFNSEADFVTFIQAAYNSDIAVGATVNFLLVMVDDGDAVEWENAIPRTDQGSVTGIGTADLIIDYTLSGPDTAPPVWISGWPKVDGVTDDGATARTRTDENGTAYYVVVADGATAPDAAQVKAGLDYSGVTVVDSGSIALSAGTENTAAITGLSPSTAYDVYFVAEDDETTPNLQTTPELVEITTLTPDTTAPSWTVSYPQVDGVTTTSATARAAIDEPGTAYYVVVADGATAPSSAEVKAGTGFGGSGELASGSIVLSAADAENTAAITGLSPGTAYDVYFVAEDDETTPNLQAAPVLVEITTQVPAPTIVNYDFEAASLDNPTTEATNTSSSTMTNSGFGGSGRSGDGNYFGRGVSTTPVTSYVAFTITADSGFTLDLDQLDFDYYVQQEQSQSTGGTFTFEVRSSIDSFASATAGTYSLNPAGVTAPYQAAAFDLTGGSYDGLASIEFRFYATSNDGDNYFNDIVRWDNIAVTGSVTSGGGGGTFAGWIGGWGLDEADKDFTDDPDGDGLDNGVEAFFGTNPAEAGPGLTQVVKSGNLFSFQHPEADPALTDVIGSYEWSIDLQNWHPEGTVGDTTVTISASKDNPATGTTTVTADTSGSTTAPTKLFLRVVATPGT